MKTNTLDQASVRQYGKALRLPAVVGNFAALAEQAVKENQTHVRYLEALLALECEERDRQAIANRSRDTQLPRLKTIEEFAFAQAPRVPAAKIRELAEGGYIERSEPVIFIGDCGTGKTHLATGRWRLWLNGQAVEVRRDKYAVPRAVGRPNVLSRRR